MTTVRTCRECGSQLPPGGGALALPQLPVGASGRRDPRRAGHFGLRCSGQPELPAGKDEAFPQRFGGYELLERIGQGGMSIVYKAWAKSAWTASSR